MSTPGRLFPYQLGDPVENMSTDQVLLETVDAGGPPTLRFYGWQEPTVSLGYFQQLDDRRLHQPSKSLACVRRATGGGAIIHDRELTYSIVIPPERNDRGAVSQLYRHVHAATIDVLSRFEIPAVPFRSAGRSADANSDAFLCFQRRTEEDLIVAGYKVLGSAQRRGRAAVLQHGSLLLNASFHAAELPGIGELTSRQFSPDELAQQIEHAISGRLEIDWQSDCLTRDECQRSDDIGSGRFGSDAWQRRC